MDSSLRERLLNTIGVGLLALCFAVALGRIIWKSLPQASASNPETVIRFAHWQLEGGVREAFDAIAREYMERNPGVRVVQIPVPERIFPNWLITQLVGGTAPDIIAIFTSVTDERKARYFRPMSELVNLPNPWNRGTALEGVPLRETFFDGMESCFTANLLEYYGVPVSAYSIRMFFNLDLLKEITGSDDLPQTYGELVELAREVKEYARRTGKNIFPIAGSKYNSPVLMRRLFMSQTENLTRSLTYDFLGGSPGVPSPPAMARSYAEGAWSFDSPEVRAGLALMRDVGQYMQPGFLQLGRDDASFYFVQGKAVMIVTGSWDATSITTQADFRVGVGYIPVPAPGEEMGPFSIGPIADSSANAGLIMGLTRQSENPAAALDFLYFLVSRDMNQLFTNVSKWPPAVVGVEPHNQAKIFQPFLDGNHGGFDLAFSGGDSRRVTGNAINVLVGPVGSVDAYVETARTRYGEALAADLTRMNYDAATVAQRLDTTLGALGWLALRQPDDSQISEKLDLLLEALPERDFNAYRIREAREEVLSTLQN
jgi:raffinose/stachyose/melibiose transport system substrate-binding protein